MGDYDRTRYMQLWANGEVKTAGGSLIATSFTRVVHGGRGDYIEMDDSAVVRSSLRVPPDKRWKLRSRDVYYHEYRTVPDNIKVYFQVREVKYADYRAGMWYVHPKGVLGFAPAHVIRVDKYQRTLYDFVPGEHHEAMLEMPVPGRTRGCL